VFGLKSEENKTMIQSRKEIAMLNNDILNYLENLLGAFNRQIEISDRYIKDYEDAIRKLPKSAQGVMKSKYSDSWTVNYHPVYSCVTAVHPISLRVHASTVMQFCQ
jgi:proline dehydrogenase